MASLALPTGPVATGHGVSADRLTRHPVYGEICQMIAELEMVSQARAYGVLDIAAASDGSEDVGGRKPSGGIHPSDYQDSPDHFRKRLEHCASQAGLAGIASDLRRALDGWRHQSRKTPGGLPVWGTLEFVEFVVDNPRGLTQREIGELYGKSHVAVGKIKRKHSAATS